MYPTYVFLFRSMFFFFNQYTTHRYGYDTLKAFIIIMGLTMLQYKFKKEIKIIIL